MLNSIIERGYLVIQNGTFRHRRHIGFTRQPGALIEEGRATMSPQFTVSPHICSSSNKDGSIILNVERGLLYSLIGVGSLMWTKLTAHPGGLTLDAIVRSISTHFERVPPHQIKRDVENLLTQLSQKGIVEVRDSRVERTAETTRAWLSNNVQLMAYITVKLLLDLRLKTLAAFFGIGAVNMMLSMWGFRAVHQVVRGWPVNNKSASPETQREVSEAVDKATTWYPSQAMCLQRSAITVCLLRQYGVFAELVIGCRKIPFKAHAWVEVDGQVVNDKRQVQEFYSVLDRC